MPAYSALAPFQRLSTKIVGVLIGFLLLALAAIGATLWLSWQLEGAAAAINETGSLRRHNYRLALALPRTQEAPIIDAYARVERQIATIDATLLLLERGDPQRPLGLPPTPAIHSAFLDVARRWGGQVRPAARQVLQLEGPARSEALRLFDNQLEDYVADLDRLVNLIERDNELRTFWLRASQLVLVALAIGGTVALVYLMFAMIVAPVMRLREGMRSMAGSDFGVRLDVESRDEFGQLSSGFNEMADRLQHLYCHLEDEVRRKTASLEDKNRELALLYDCAAFLQQRHTLETMCSGFLSRIAAYFGAAGSTVRIVDPGNENMHMVVHDGLSNEMAEAERCMKIGECLCGEAAARKISVVHKLEDMPQAGPLACSREGFATISVFQIHAQDQHVGLFSLHFLQARSFSEREQALLETLAKLVGVAIENMRLAAREREMAISEERNLVARGLHDSIAQGLNFLNLQVQMLETSLAAGRPAEASEIVPLLRAGVQESYEDVRELLLNFRSRLAEEDLNAALHKTVRKFADQTSIDTAFSVHGKGGPPIEREAQLQILFIVQEALSNVRKHARASRVEVRVDDGDDYLVTVTDDGAGFDAGARPDADGGHVGLHIMGERAGRIGASLGIESQAGAGTTVRLHLGQAQRRAA
ncbi:type IV pili methyl-accepting chemotaxis transducer N-terminal domain-containing protein [Massilia oculi]|uniref:type IV pili methyl-accepting chemotaxis transducer N-terminal domain-containing protein n=1 Tax=Massilia oculi TaxID=945844 RepID=UPI001AAE98C2|nr:type IV pili methyl-accepting chemotaxis transducer N-terminal domain-containing protein [Massilia oculi]